MISNAEQTVEIFSYYENRFNKTFILKAPSNILTQHYMLIVFLSIFETYYTSNFVIPILVALFTQFLCIRSLYKTRVIAKCIHLEMDNEDEISEEDKEDIFKICCEEMNSLGFLYTRSVLIIKSCVLMFLVYYATIGLSI
jgi:hypothetical protein